MGVLTRPNSSTCYRDLPPSEQIGGYPKPSQLSNVVDEMTLDSEGRCVILEFPAFVLLGVYSPANRDESRDEFRISFLEALDARIRNLVAEGKQVILTGDLNVISSEKDTCNLAERLRKEGMSAADFFSSPSRRLFNQLLYEGHVFGARDEDKDPVLWDLCRVFHKEREGMFTCWDTKKNTRPANFGSRIDYVLCSNGIKEWFIDANIQEGLMGSDHCPVFGIISDTVTAQNGEKAHILDLMNPDGMFRDGQRLREWSSKDLLPLSAKLIPEFDRRRSIKDMFMKKTQPAKATPPTTLTTENTGSTLGTFQDDIGDNNDTTSMGMPPPSKPTGYDSPQKPSSQASSTSGPTERSPAKRPAATSPVKSLARASKRPKQGQTQAGTSTPKTNSGQSTLKAFFRPKSTPGNSKPAPPTASTSTLSTDTEDAGGGFNSGPSTQAQTPVASTPSESNNEVSSDEKRESDSVFDPIENKESWSKLLGKRVLPKCEHGETCISLVTKKPGVNCGKLLLDHFACRLYDSFTSCHDLLNLTIVLS